MPAPLQNVQFPQIAQAEALMRQALDHYHALQQMAQQDASTFDLLDQLRDLFEQTQPVIQRQLNQSLLPPDTLARLGIAWEACAQEYDSFSFVFAEYDDDLVDEEDLDGAVFSALITQIRACAFNLNAAIQDHQQQKQYWDAQAERRETLEAFLQPAGKEDWVTKTLLDAQRAVADAYFEALKSEKTPDYVEAGRLLNQAWRAYREATALHGQQEQVAERLLDDGGLDDVRDMLDEIDDALKQATDRAAPSRAPYLENLTAEARRHREGLRLYLEQHQRALSEDITPPASLACQDAITALHATVQNLDDPDAQDALQDLQRSQQDAAGPLKTALAELQTALDAAQRAYDDLNAVLAKLDGAGCNRKQISARWRKLRKIERQLQTLRDQHNTLSGQGQQLLQSVGAATTPAMLTDAAAPIPAFLSGPVPSLVRDLSAFATQTATRAQQPQSDLTGMDAQLKQLQDRIQAAQTELNSRLAWYRSNSPPIPDTYINSKQTLLDNVMALGTVRNLQALTAASARLETLVAGGTESEFPTQAEAMAIFSKSLGERENLQNRVLSLMPSMFSATSAMNAEAAEIANDLEVIDLAALETLYRAAALDIKPTFPAWDAALDKRRTELVTAVRANGPMGDTVKKEATDLHEEITTSKSEALKLKALQEAVETQYNQLNSRLRTQRRATQSLLGGLARDIGATLVFSALSETLEGPTEKARQKALKTFKTLNSIKAAKEQTKALEAVQTAFKALLDSDSTDHLITIQRDAAAAAADKARQDQENEAEWQRLRQAFGTSRDDAQRAGASEADITSISAVFQQVSTDYAEDMAKTRSTVQALIRRLESAAQNPEQRFESVGAALSGLQQQWQADVAAYLQAVDTLIAQVTTAGTGADATNATQATTRLATLRTLFTVDLFQTDVFFLTTESAIPLDQRIAARERALTNLRAARRSLEGHPFLRLCFVNPFSPLPLSALLSTLNKLELNLIQST